VRHSRLAAGLCAGLFVSCLSLPFDLGNGPGRTHSQEAKDCREVVAKGELVTSDAPEIHLLMSEDEAFIQIDADSYRTVKLKQTVCGEWKTRAAERDSLSSPQPQSPPKGEGDEIQTFRIPEVEHAVLRGAAAVPDDPIVSPLAGRYSRSSRWGNPEKWMELGRAILRSWLADRERLRNGGK